MALKHVPSNLKFVNWLFPDTHLKLCNLVKGSLELVLESIKLGINPSLYKLVQIKFETGLRCCFLSYRVSVKMEQFLISGLLQGELLPQLVQTKGSSIASTPATSPASPSSAVPGPLLDVVFEINPLDNKCDQKVHVSSQPLHVVYDALTINKVIDVFTVEQNAVITQ